MMQPSPKCIEDYCAADGHSEAECPCHCHDVTFKQAQTEAMKPAGQFIKGNWVPDRRWLGPETFARVSQRQARFEVMERALTNLLHDLRILSGEIVGPSGVAWQDVAGTAAVNAQVLADQLTQARAGNSHGPIVFPSPSECLEGKESV